MKKSSLVSLVLAVVLLAAVLPMRADAASAAGFPLPTTSTYTVSALSNYSGGARHSSYLYTYGPMRNATYDPYCLADIPAPRGTPIYAVADGVVLTNTYGSGGGYYLVLRHNDGTYSYYGHMREQSGLRVGTSVRAGGVLGYVGMTGTATGYHLHFEWSGHDPYCEYSARGYITGRTLAAAVYPHQHSAAGGTGNSCAVTTGAVDTITQTGAVLRGSVSASGAKVTECGVFLGTSRTNMQKLGSDTINTYGTSFYYSTAKYGRTLTAGTTYYYQAYAKVGNTTYYGAICTFQTPSGPTANWYYAYANVPTGTRHLAINSTAAAGSQIGRIPHCGQVKVYPGKSSGNWLWVEYNGVSGYAYKAYLTTTKP